MTNPETQQKEKVSVFEKNTNRDPPKNAEEISLFLPSQAQSSSGEHQAICTRETIGTTAATTDTPSAPTHSQALHMTPTAVSVPSGGSTRMQIASLPGTTTNVTSSVSGPLQAAFREAESVRTAQNPLMPRPSTQVTAFHNPSSTHTVSSQGRQVALTIPHPAVGGPIHLGLGIPHSASIPIQLPPMGVGIAPPGTIYQMAAAIKASETPPIFRDRQQRSGKWTREEEIYADLLIELFEKGHIDEKNGCTLRSFLSRKLHCAPMRISKKYAGKGIGKMVFLSKNGFQGTGDGIGSPAYHTNMRRLRKAEENFYKSCYPEIGMMHHAAFSAPPQHLLAGTIPRPGTSVITVQPSAPQGQFPATSGNLFPNIGASTLGQTTYWVPTQSPTLTVPGQKFSIDLGSGLNGGQTAEKAKSSSSDQIPVPSANFPISLSAQQSLEKAYLRVANSVKQGCSVVANIKPSEGTQIENAGTATATQQVGILKGAEKDDPNIKKGKGSNKQENEATVPTDIPDFLSGFDKVAKQTKVLTTGNTPQYSPSFTSQSFDDFHRLLGKNLSPVTAASGESRLAIVTNTKIVQEVSTPISTSATSTGANPTSVLGTQDTNTTHTKPQLTLPRHTDQHHHMLGRAYSEALSAGTNETKSSSNDHLGADFYNIFAQMSAFAASQHSAYSSSGFREGHERTKASISQDTPITKDQALLYGQSSSLSAPISNKALRAVHNPSLVSEPSNTSDQGTEESDDSPGDVLTASGIIVPSDSTTSNDSDESNSESSRKKPRISYHLAKSSPVQEQENVNFLSSRNGTSKPNENQIRTDEQFIGMT